MTKPYLLFRRALLCAATAAVLAPAAASAAPDRTLTLTSAAPEAAWDGAKATSSINPVTGEYKPESCTKGEENYCDQTLLDIQSGGPVTLDVDISDYDPQQSDFDLFVYKSNASGTATEEDEITTSRNPPAGPFTAPSTGLPNGFDEGTTIKDLEPGYYLVIVSYYDAQDASYKGAAKVTGATPTAGGGTTPPPSSPPPSSPAPTPPPAAPAPAALPFKAAGTIGSARQARKRRYFSFSATAGETISGLTVQLLSGRSGTKQKVLGTAKIASFAKGTRKVKIKLSRKVAKKLKKGRYSLASRGTVNGEARQVVQAVRVKR